MLIAPFIASLRSSQDGKRILQTAPLDRGDILPGVTRQSIIDLASGWEGVEVREEFPKMGDIKKAADEGRLLEAFGSGTAAVVSPIERIHYDGADININADMGSDSITKRAWDDLNAIYYGEVEGPEGWGVDI